MKEGTMFMVMSFPAPWPRPYFYLYVEKRDDHTIQLAACDDGHLRFEIIDSSGQTTGFDFQKIAIKGTGLALVTICWDVMGGVHLGVPTVKEKQFVALESAIKLGGDSLPLKLLESIIMVSLTGLRPLVEAIEKRSANPIRNR